MHRPERIGALIIAFAFFTLYLAFASLVTFLGLPLPLGSVGTEVVLLMVIFTVLSAAFIGKRRQKQQTNPTKSVRLVRTSQTELGHWSLLLLPSRSTWT